MREHVYMTAQPTSIINIATSLDFKHYLMDDIVTLGYASVGADVINGIFGIKKGALTVSELDFIQRRFRRWCEYHGFRIHLKTDSKTGKITSYDLMLSEQMAVVA